MIVAIVLLPGCDACCAMFCTTCTALGVEKVTHLLRDLVPGSRWIIPEDDPDDREKTRISGASEKTV